MGRARFRFRASQAASPVAPIVNDQSFTIDTGYADDQAVGTVALANSPSPAATWSITGGNTGTTFAINGSTGQITLIEPGNLVADSDFSLTVQASNAAGSDTATVTVEVNAAGAAALITTITVKNMGGGSLASPVVSHLLKIAKGDLPDGARLEVRSADGLTSYTTQQDQETFWNDDSGKVANIVFQSPDTFSAAEEIPYAVYSVAGAPSRTANVTLTDLQDHDIKLKFSGGSLGSDVFFVSVNDIISGGNSEPWGTNPINGYRVIRSGALCTEWEFWGYLKRQSDSAYHKWLKASIYLRAWDADTFEIIGFVRQGNTFGAHPSGTVGSSIQLRHTFVSELYDNTTLIGAVGGANDTDGTFTFAQSGAVNTTTNRLTLPSGHNAWDGQVYRVSSSGSLLGGLATNTDYTLTFIDRAASNDVLLCTSRWAIGQPNGYSNWAGSTAYGAGWIVKNNNILYICITSGTSASSGGPTGTAADITDGTAHWACLHADLTSAGSGNITFTPMCVLYPHCGQAITQADGKGFWIGGTRPNYLVAPDIDYLLNETKAYPSYDQAVTLDAPAEELTLTPGWYQYPGDINTAGDNVGDDRIGYINHRGLFAVYNPFDEAAHQLARCVSLNFAAYHIFLEDEASGYVPVTNNGPDKAGASYTGLSAPNPTFRAYPFEGGSPAAVAPAEFGDDLVSGYDGMYERYTRWVDGSHLPAPGISAYAITGDIIHLDLAAHEFNMMVNSQYQPNTNITLGNSVTYYRLLLWDQQTRGIAWAHKLMGELMHYMPDNYVIKPYVRDISNDNAAYLKQWRQEQGSDVTTLGWFNYWEGKKEFQPWEFFYWTISLGMEMWRGENPDWADYVNNHHKRLVVGLGAECVYYAVNRELDLSPGINGSFALYTDMTDVIASAPGYAGSCPSSGFIVNVNDVPVTFANSLLYGYRCALSLLINAGVTDAQAVYDDIEARLAAASVNPTSIFSAANDAVWAIKPAA